MRDVLHGPLGFVVALVIVGVGYALGGVLDPRNRSRRNR